MHTTTRSQHRISFTLAILLSLILGFVAAWFRGGLEATPFSTVDSQGRPMGFNDVLSAEHYQIIWSNASWAGAIGQIETWTRALAGVQLVALIAVLAGQAGSRAFKWLLWIQPVGFFGGLIGMLMLPLWLVDLIRPMQGIDRESYIDVPFVEFISQGAWLWACAFMLFRLWWQKRPQTLNP